MKTNRADVQKIVVALMAMVFLLLPVGCSGSNGSVSGGGTLVLCGSEPGTLDPANCADATAAYYIVEIFSGLVTLDSNLSVVPDIAQSWNISSNGMVYTFHLRDGLDSQQILAKLLVTMRYSKLFGKTLRTAPKEAEAVSHKLLARAGFIDQLAAGVYTFLPLGWRTHQKIENIIREGMDELGGQEFSMPVLAPKSLWQETGRWETYDPKLFVVRDRHDKEYALGPTHEEVITDLARRFIKSYKDLPAYVYQIQDKFRNELRFTGGLLRTREFFMKDLYSFNADQKDFQDYFKKAIAAYLKIFERVGLKVIVSQASGGSIGGDITYEFQIPAGVGEDTVFYCESCGYAINKQFAEEKGVKEVCPDCKKKLSETRAIEAGQVFSLGTKYSEIMGAKFVDKDGKEKPIIMGCYGIGIGRLMAAIVEVYHDENGIIWSENIAPYQIHLVSIGTSEKVAKAATQVYNKLIKKGVEVLFDDREESPGVKLADADLIGIPERWVVSEKTLEKDCVEVKKRNQKESRLIKISSI